MRFNFERKYKNEEICDEFFFKLHKINLLITQGLTLFSSYFKNKISGQHIKIAHCKSINPNKIFDSLYDNEVIGIKIMDNGGTYAIGFDLYLEIPIPVDLCQNKWKCITREIL